MVRDDGLKLIWSEADPPLLFDLDNDPRELCNLAKDPAYAGGASQAGRYDAKELGSGRPANGRSCEPARTSLHLAGAHDRPPHQLGLPAPDRRLAALLAQHAEHGRAGSGPPLAAGEPGTVTLDGQRVLVTGATGFVGRHLVRTLAEETGASLRLVTRAGGQDDLPAAARSTSELVRADLTDAARLPELCRGVDTVIHAAALMPGRPDAWKQGQTVCLHGLQLTEAARDAWHFPYGYAEPGQDLARVQTAQALAFLAVDRAQAELAGHAGEDIWNQGRLSDQRTIEIEDREAVAHGRPSCGKGGFAWLFNRLGRVVDWSGSQCSSFSPTE